MRLDLATWQEVDEYLKNSGGVIIPTGSTEQHGPMGLIGTDALCAEQIALKTGEKIGVYVAPTLAYTPAPFNMSFPGTISISASLFETLVVEIISSLAHHGFNKIYFINEGESFFGGLVASPGGWVLCVACVMAISEGVACIPSQSPNLFLRIEFTASKSHQLLMRILTSGKVFTAFLMGSILAPWPFIK